MINKIILSLVILITCGTSLANNDMPIRTFVATSYCLGSPSCKEKSRGITATGERVRKGIIAVDRRVIKLGTYVKIIEPKEYAGTYKASDVGSRIRGNKIDIWLASQAASKKFGIRKIKLIILPDSLRSISERNYME